jgi:hypothetical protein
MNTNLLVCALLLCLAGVQALAPARLTTGSAMCRSRSSALLSRRPTLLFQGSEFVREDREEPKPKPSSLLTPAAPAAVTPPEAPEAPEDKKPADEEESEEESMKAPAEEEESKQEISNSMRERLIKEMQSQGADPNYSAGAVKGNPILIISVVIAFLVIAGGKDILY